MNAPLSLACLPSIADRTILKQTNIPFSLSVYMQLYTKPAHSELFSPRRCSATYVLT
jgi:hypothetical protein